MIIKRKENKELWEKFESHLHNEGLTLKRISKLEGMFRMTSREIEFNRAGREEIERFIQKLNENSFRKENGKPYSGCTKIDMKKFLKQFFKWYKGKGEAYPEEVSWIKTRLAKDEIPEKKNIVGKEDAIELANQFKKKELQVMVLILFDSGFRIQEMLSSKKKDLTKDTFDEEGNECFWIRCNKSKTFQRNIPIPMFNKEISEWTRTESFIKKNEEEPLFNIKYSNFTKMLGIHSERLLKKRITPHCLRHSSATYYAKEYNGNVIMLAQRYGWSYDAKELKVYVRESGVHNKQGAQISYNNRNAELEREIESLKKEVSEIQQKTMKELIGFLKKKKVL